MYIIIVSVMKNSNGYIISITMVKTLRGDQAVTAGYAIYFVTRVDCLPPTGDHER